MIQKTIIVSIFFLLTFLAAFAFRLTYISNPNWVAIYMPSEAADAQLFSLVRSVDARLVRGSKIQNIHVLHADHPNLRDELHKRGIWLTLDPVVLQGCGLIAYE